MRIPHNPIVAAITLLLSASPVYADGGEAGANGDGSEIRGESFGSIGVNGPNADGGDGASFTAGFTINNVFSQDFTAGKDGQPAMTLDGGSGAGGHGGGSVIGATSTGGAAGYSSPTFSLANVGNGWAVTGNTSSADGGDGGAVTDNTITLTDVTLTGAAGGEGGIVTATTSIGGAGAGGHGGGSVFGGISTGGAAGYSRSYTPPRFSTSSSADGGDGGAVTGNTITLKDVTLTGAAGGEGGSITYSDSRSGAGSGGHGGGSVFGGISTGGAAGYASGDATNTLPPIAGGGDGGDSTSTSSADGGDGGAVTDNTITLTDVTLTGAAGGAGGSSNSNGGTGSGGHGGGSVFGGISTGGAAGDSSSYIVGTPFYSPTTSSANGGDGGAVTDNIITLTDVTLIGAAGGAGGNLGSDGGTGSGGHGGGSVFGGISTGGAAGYSTASSTASSTSSSTSSAKGGDGGAVIGNMIILTNVTLNGTNASGGQGGVSVNGGKGADGRQGGSVFGGISQGGAGGFVDSLQTQMSSNGGNGGEVSGNFIEISGITSITGDIYGGFSQGGAKGNIGVDGKGGLVKNNTVIIIGDDVSIEGSIFGGLSIDGDGNPNPDPTYSSYYAGNTLQMQSGHFLLKGSIQNFQYYNWLLPENELNGGTIITVDASGTAVNLDNTIHSVDVKATGNVLEAGDQVVLITKVTGQPTLKPQSRIYIEQGFFIVYDAEMAVRAVSGEDALVLNVLGVNGGGPVGQVHPESEEFLKGRIAQLAMVDQGADMISDGISYARASLRKENANIFAIVDGGSNKYKNGGVSTLKLNDFKLALGAAKAFEFENKSVGMIAAFAEHGNGNYSSYNYFDYFGDTRGSGKVRYSGVGLMGHIDVAGTDVSKVKNKPNIFDDKYGLYLDAALRVGHVKVDFQSADMVNGAGVEASYNTKSRYSSAMLGAGYVWTLDEKSAMDFYSRFTFSRMNGKDIQVVDEQMNAGSAHSKRLRLGARYGYAYSPTTTPYAGLAWERNFTGDVSGSAYGFTIKENSLKGNTGILEAGVVVKPKGADDAFSLRFGVQGYFGQRKGATADVRARYVF